MARIWFSKQLSEIPLENAHGGSGKRQLLLSAQDPVCRNLEAMTKGFLADGGVFDWHAHEGVDEFFLVTKGSGAILFAGADTKTYNAGELIYIPAGLKHRIENTGGEESEFYFIRVKC